MKRILWLLLILLPLDAFAGVNRYTYRPKDQSGNPSAPVPQFIMVDTEAELPSTGVAEGDLAYTKDSDKTWKRTASAWVEIGGGAGGGAPTDAQYWTGAANASLSAEKDLSALSTGLVVNTSGTPSAYAGATCTNQFARSLNASGVATCASVSTNDLTDANVTFAKIQDVTAASRLLGRGDSGAGDVQEITLGSGLAMTGTQLSATGGGGGLSHAAVMGRASLGF